MKAYIKLLRNAAAAVLLYAAAGVYAAEIPVTTGYEIRKDVKQTDGTTTKQVCCSFALSVDKVQYNLTVPANTYSGYTAAYEDNSGNWQVLQPKNETTEWNAVTDTTKKGKLAKLFTPVLNQNMEIAPTDGTTAELTSAGYIAQSESPALPAEISGQAYAGIALPTLSGGRFYLAEYGAGTTYLLTFKTSGSFMELEEEARSKEKLTKKKISDNMFAWLDAKDKKNCAYPALSEKLAEMLAESLIKDDAFDGLYEADGNEYIRLYLQNAFDNGRSIYADSLHNSEPLYNPKGCEKISPDTGSLLAVEAEKYLTNGVEWGENTGKNMIYEASSDKEYPSDDKSMNGNPLPYSKDGIDTPETFWYKMKTQAEKNKWKTTALTRFFRWSRYNKALYIPGDKDGTAAGCGTDSWGLLTGCIKGAGLAESIRCVENGVIKEPAKELASYADDIRSDAAGQYGDGSRKNSEAFADMQYDYKGLKQTSIIVPYLSKVQPGDILYGKQKATGGELVGIITEKGTDSTDPEAFMKGTKVVWMDRKSGCAVSTSWKTFSDTVGNLRCLRLLQRKETSEKYEQAESWDVLDKVPAGAELEIGSMSEESQVSSDRWRWIPNTGEYLVLRKLSVQLKNRSGMKLKPETGSSYNIKLAGAYDRIVKSETEAPSSPGNIDNNRASAFDVAFLETSYTITPEGTMSSTEPDGSDKKLYSFSLTAGTDPVMHISAAGRLCTPDGKEAAIGIRPESAERAYPGDDLFLSFTAENSTNKSDDKLVFQAKDSDYIAVYDKKLLWRANLYIEQKESALGDIDWNNAHPWNVPPADGVAQEGVCPKSWSDSWGYNEWNRKMAPDPQFTGTATVGLSNLPAGNGGQVVTFPEFTPLRTIPAGQIPGSDNVLSKTVAYSYPDHPEEKPDNSKGDAGSMDSPFDFVWKMEKQKTLLASAYDTSGNTKTATSTSSWDDTKSPKDTWNKYKRGSPAAAGTEAKQAFIPGLGLYYGARNKGYSTIYDETGLPGKSDETWNWKYTFEAGTDCVGFAQRTSSYKYCRHYEWFTLPDGIMDAGNADYNAVQNLYNSNRHIPRETSYGNSIIHNKVGIESNAYFDTSEDSIASMNENQKKLLHCKLEKIVPGDIWMKESSKSPGSWNAHIAVVAYVPQNALELSVSDLMNQIILVEAEFTNKIQSVIKVLSVGDYNDSKIPLGLQIYPNFTTPETGDEIDLNCKSWAIRRLKWTE